MRRVLGALLLVSVLSGLASAELTHRYSFNDGTARDSVGQANGLVVNNPKIEEGELVFDPEINDGRNTNPKKGQYVELPPGLVNHRSWTIELWTTYRGGGPWQRIVDFGNSVKATKEEKARNNSDAKKAKRGNGFLAIMHNVNGSLVGQCSIASWGKRADTDFCDGHEGLSLDREHHVVYTHDLDLGEQRLYLDGKLIATTQARVDAREAEWEKCYIGRSQFSWDPLYNGSVNELRIYDHALSDDDVRAHRKAGPNGKVK